MRATEQAPEKGPKSPRGAALILVLVFLALVAVLVLGFFNSVQSELKNARTYVSVVTVKQLGESATNIVMGQILDGTQSFSVPGNTSSPRLTWASQPGLIHTYVDDGTPGRTFKLYSSANMVEAAGSDYLPIQQLATEVPNDWPSAPALFTDLNRPVLVPDAQGTIPLGKTTYTAHYPIVDPLAMLGNGVEGFSIQSAPGFSSPTWAPDPTYDPTRSNNPSYTANPAPMPVRWLYVLKDGTITAPDDGGTTTATWTTAGSHPQPSKTNPIVGRIAFWTDDETCKLNINTASEGVFWDRAWALNNSTSPYGEAQLNTNAPVRGEFNRYPGHPAMTCLSPVLGGLIPSMNPPAGDALTVADYLTYYKPYYDLVPRVNSGGSQGGTFSTYTATSGAITPDANRLYASLDELMFAAPDGTTAGPAASSPVRAENPNITKPVLERAKFFLTTYNRSPEVNAFGRPRICLWPLQQVNDPSGLRPRNARDEMMAFCSTINNEPYYFQRYSIYQPAKNNNGQFDQKPAPSSQHPSLDWTNIPRNQQLYAYLQNLTDTPIPGWGKKLTDKYPVTGLVRDQILTEMFDLIRSGVNTYAIDKALTPQYFYCPSRSNGAAPGETSAVPLVLPNGTKGTGRFPTVTEAALIFYATQKDDKTGNATSMRCLLVLQPYTPMAGLWTYSPLVHYKVTGLDQFRINGVSSYFRSELHNLVTSRCGYGSGGNHTQAFTGLYASFRRWLRAGWDQNKTVPAGPVTMGMDPEANYCLVSDEIPINPGANKGEFGFTGGEITIEVYGGYGTNPTPPPEMLVQTIKLKFPDASAWPLPTYSPKYSNFNARLDGDPPINGSYAHVFHSSATKDDTSTDTVRSVQVDPTGPTKGDLRMIVENCTVPSTYYAPFPGSSSPSLPGYSDPNAHFVFSMRNGEPFVPNSSVHADLFSKLNSSPGNPIAARGMRGAFLSNNLPGDFDNGAYNRPDGAYCNKPDDYFGSEGSGDNTGSQIVTPNRQVCSAVMFGSLPTGVLSGQPWQTLLFCPNPSAGPELANSTLPEHPGFQKIHDHVFLDFFTMPVVEPYAISEPCSTAGKVNLNYQIAPFTYMTRSTALRGVLKSTRVMAIPNAAINYKSSGNSAMFRLAINRDETLKGFDQRFAKASPTGAYHGGAGFFRSASEICDMYLVPSNANLASMPTYWQGYTFTGDNAREFPYSHIYERITTKSNVYTIHMCVQVLKKNSTTDPTQWVENKDTVLSEYRGSTMVERYVDPSDPRLPDFASTPSATLDDYYRFRILNTKRFAP